MTVAPSAPAPRVSVVLATWNWSSALACSIPSVLAQTLAELELLVIGDGCTDDSAAVVASFDDARIRWHNLPARTGTQVAPNNAGVAMARAPLVAYLGHDDLWHPEHLATLVDVVERTGADLAWGVTVFYGPPGSGIRAVTGLERVADGVPPRFVPPSSWLHRRELLERIGGWRDHRSLTLPHDHELLLRAWSAGARLAASGELTVFKFPAAWRRDSYVARRTEEQRALLAQLAEPHFREGELRAVRDAEAAGKLVDVGAVTAAQKGSSSRRARHSKARRRRSRRNSARHAWCTRSIALCRGSSGTARSDIPSAAPSSGADRRRLRPCTCRSPMTATPR